MAHIDAIPYFDERFLYYGNDKVLHHSKLILQQFRYFVVPEHFLFHIEHEKSTWLQETKKFLERKILIITRIAQQEMRQQYTQQFLSLIQEESSNTSNK